MEYIKFYRRAMKDFLNKPGREWLYGLLGTLHTTVRNRKFAHVFFDNGVWVHRYSDGSVTDRHINHSLSLKKYIYDAKDYWTFAYHSKPGDVIVDIGAGKGEDTPFFSHAAGPSGRVIAIEAHPATFRCLSALCQYNHLTNVTPIQAAICEKEQQVIIDNPQSDIMSRLIQEKGGLTVQGSTLDQLLDAQGVMDIDFIKMNIEGAERMAIQGMQRCLQRTKYVCISCHDFLADREGYSDEMHTKKEITDFLRSCGFRILPRDGDPRPYIRDQVNAVNENLVSISHR